jgi:Zn-dependent protease with chaperone function
MDQKYSVFFTGSLASDQSQNESIIKLERILGLKPESALNLVSKESLTKIKGGLDQRRANALGKKLERCGLVITIVSERGVPQVKTKVDSYKDLKISLTGKPKKIKTPFGYSLRLFFTALVTLIMPLIYLSIIITVAYLIYAYVNGVLYSGWSILGASRPITKLVELVALPFVGVLLLVFLVRPFFSSYLKEPSLMLSKTSESDFFELVHALCDSVGAPRPTKIYVNNSVNAYASFDGGLNGLITNKLVLGIGMPLFNGMSAQQLVGILAHEFGHFTQRGGMIATYLINRVNGWLYSRAYTRDSFDETVERWYEESEFSYWYISVVILRACIASTRALFKQLFNLSMKVSMSLSRDMEYHADSFEAEVSGSKTFAETARILRGLSMAESIVESINDDFLADEQRIFEDVPAAIVDVYRRFSTERNESIERQMRIQQVSVWDSHPLIWIE